MSRPPPSSRCSGSSARRALNMWSEIIRSRVAEVVARHRKLDHLVGGQECDPLVEPHALRRIPLPGAPG